MKYYSILWIEYNWFHERWNLPDQCSVNQRKYLLHVYYHQRGYASRKDNQHGDDVDHGVPLKVLSVAVVVDWAAEELPVEILLTGVVDDGTFWLGYHVSITADLLHKLIILLLYYSLLLDFQFTTTWMWVYQPYSFGVETKIITFYPSLEIDFSLWERAVARTQSTLLLSNLLLFLTTQPSQNTASSS